MDQAVELLVQRPEWGDEEAAWQVMTGLADRLFDLGVKEFGEPARPKRHDQFPAGDFRSYVKHAQPKIQTNGVGLSIGPNGEDTFVVRADEIEAGFFSTHNLLVSTGSVVGLLGRDGVTRDSWLAGCVVFAGGPVNVSEFDGGIVVCDGDVTAKRISGSLIVARGDVRGSAVFGSRIIAGGKLDLPRDAEDRGTLAKGNEPNPLGFVKWFDPASVGVVVEKAEGGVRVKKAIEGKAFARAGLKVGDLIVNADGKAVGSPDDFRRLLRQHLATEEELPLEVRRDGQAVKVVVSLERGNP